MKGTKILIVLMIVTMFLLSACARYAVVTEEDGDNGFEDVTVNDDAGNAIGTTGEEVTTEDNVNVDEEQTEEITEEEATEKEVSEEVTTEDNTNADEEQTEKATEEDTTEKEVSEEVTTEEEQQVEEEAAPVLEYTEGDVVDLTKRIKVSDEDNDELEISFSKPLNEDGIWETEKGDAGLYPVTITVSDGETEVSKQVIIRIKPLNNPPVISGLDDIVVEEGEVIKLEPKVTDEDGDDVKITYSGWMTSSTYKTTYDDAGTYSVTVTATDGKDTTTKRIKITVVNVNRPPQLVIE